MNPTTEENFQPSQLIPQVSEEDHIKGPFDAPLTLVEYGDYQCPACGSAFPVTHLVQRSLGKRLRFVFRNFPLTSIHPRAEEAAEAAEAAAAQGHFWEMHDLLYENQEALEIEDFVEYAETLNLDADRLVREIEEGTYRDRIKRDFRGGVRSGVNGTPTFFVNGIRYDGPADPEALIAELTASRAMRS